MSAEHKVTTEFVRRHYAQGPTAYFEDGTVAKWPTAVDVEYAGRQFDRWLTEHDKAVSAKSLRDWADYQEHSLDTFAYCVDDDDRAETNAWCKAARLYADSIEHPKVVG